MQKIILTAALAILVALAGCSDPAQTPEASTLSPASTPTRAPSPTQEPTAAAAPTATTAGPSATKPVPVLVATATPEPTVTSTPTTVRKDDKPAGVLSPLVLDDPMYDDPEDVNALLSEAELACIKEVGPAMDLSWNWILPGSGDRKDRAKIILCLDDEILARIFLADIAEGVGPLSLECSTCVRAAFNEIDPRSMMMARVEGFPEGTLSSATAIHFVTMACLNDEEWETTAEWVQEGSELREWMRCIMEKLGGPGEMATAMTRGEEEDQKALADAAEDCAGEMGPPSDQEEPGLPQHPRVHPPRQHPHPNWRPP